MSVLRLKSEEPIFLEEKVEEKKKEKEKGEKVKVKEKGKEEKKEKEKEKEGCITYLSGVLPLCCLGEVVHEV